MPLTTIGASTPCILNWLHVRRQLPKEDALEMGPEAEAWVRTSLLALLPIYRTILWSPD